MSRKTVFTAVGGKAELLALALDRAIAGDDAPNAVAALGGLRDDLTRSESVDLACLLTEPLLHRRLVGARQWSGSRFEAWLADTLRQQVLRS